MTFGRSNSQAEAIFFRIFQHTNTVILTILRRFLRNLKRGISKYARITIMHVCFIALTLLGLSEDV